MDGDITGTVHLLRSALSNLTINLSTEGCLLDEAGILVATLPSNVITIPAGSDRATFRIQTLSSPNTLSAITCTVRAHYGDEHAAANFTVEPLRMASCQYRARGGDRPVYRDRHHCAECATCGQQNCHVDEQQFDSTIRHHRQRAIHCQCYVHQRQQPAHSSSGRQRGDTTHYRDDYGQAGSANANSSNHRSPRDLEENSIWNKPETQELRKVRQVKSGQSRGASSCSWWA